MDISITKASKRQIEPFEKRVWHDANIEHFGKDVPWFEKKFIFKATIDSQVVGTVSGKFSPGVLYIESLIVDKAYQRQGVGKRLIERATSFAKKHNVHKMSLTTGIDWEATKFYESLGFTKVCILKNHYYHIDCILYEKII